MNSPDIPANISVSQMKNKHRWADLQGEPKQQMVTIWTTGQDQTSETLSFQVVSLYFARNKSAK